MRRHPGKPRTQLRLHVGVPNVVQVRCRHRRSRQCVSGPILATWHVPNVQVKLSELLQPAQPASCLTWLHAHINQWLMIGAHPSLLPVQIWPPALGCEEQRQKLPICGVVIAFSCAQLAREIGYRLGANPSVLLQHCTNANGAGVSYQLKR